MSSELESLFGDLEKTFSGPSVTKVMKVLTPMQLAKAITVIAARKKGDGTLVEKTGLEFLASLTGDQKTALAEMAPAVAAKLLKLAAPK